MNSEQVTVYDCAHCRRMYFDAAAAVQCGRVCGSREFPCPSCTARHPTVEGAMTCFCRSRAAVEHSTRIDHSTRGVSYTAFTEALKAAYSSVVYAVPVVYKKPEPTPEEKWAEHLRQEESIAAKMQTVGFPLTRLTAAEERAQFQGHWEPSISGLAGGSVGVWRRR